MLTKMKILILPGLWSLYGGGGGCLVFCVATPNFFITIVTDAGHYDDSFISDIHSA